MAWAIRAEKSLCPWRFGPDVEGPGKSPPTAPVVVEPVLVAVLRGHQTVGGQQDGAAKASKSSFCCHQALPQLPTKLGYF